ncbi:MAG: aconitase X [Granulosicoccus sp.]
MSGSPLRGLSLVTGHTQGPILKSTVALSFWGGVDPVSGLVIDQHHPLKGQNVAGSILAIPSGRGSCTGSSVLLELILNDCAPAGLIVCEREEILTLGVIIAEVMFKKSLPIIQLSKSDFQKLKSNCFVKLDDEVLTLSTEPLKKESPTSGVESSTPRAIPQQLELGTEDQKLLNGEHGKAAQIAMQVVCRMAGIQGATQLIDVSQAHIDGCVYNGPSSLLFATQLNDWGAKVRVPTTLNSISVDQRRWQQQGIDKAFGEPASQLGDAYMKMGAQLSFTCAPYLLDTLPKHGEQIVWAESNAVVFANSVLGARTQKYADFMDICVALTARAPYSGSHIDSGRLPGSQIIVEANDSANDAYWPLLGYQIGLLTVNDIPIIYGLEESAPSDDDLKAFSAAFATTSSVAMFHMAGVTPESSIANEFARSSLSKVNNVRVTAKMLRQSWHELNSATNANVDVVCLGNPHFSLNECSLLAKLCSDQQKKDGLRIYVTLGRAIHEKANQAGYVEILEQFGVEFITDTCWCMLSAPVIPDSAEVLMTNSGKYAHYAPGLVGKSIYFDSLENCVAAACNGQHKSVTPVWLS